jgi:hypothetical protein
MARFEVENEGPLPVEILGATIHGGQLGHAPVGTRRVLSLTSRGGAASSPQRSDGRNGAWL